MLVMQFFIQNQSLIIVTSTMFYLANIICYIIIVVCSIKMVKFIRKNAIKFKKHDLERQITRSLIAMVLIGYSLAGIFFWDKCQTAETCSRPKNIFFDICEKFGIFRNFFNDSFFIYLKINRN